jgi:hypothetical protein
MGRRTRTGEEAAGAWTVGCVRRADERRRERERERER